MFLRLHGENLAWDEELRNAVAEWRSKSEGVKVGGLAGYAGGVFGFLRSTR